jgi:hypothetical protein
LPIVDHLLRDLFQSLPRFPAQETKTGVSLLFGNPIEVLDNLLRPRDQLPLLNFFFQFG